MAWDVIFKYVNGGADSFYKRDYATEAEALADAAFILASGFYHTHPEAPTTYNSSPLSIFSSRIDPPPIGGGEPTRTFLGVGLTPPETPYRSRWFINQI